MLATGDDKLVAIDRRERDGVVVAKYVLGVSCSELVVEAVAHLLSVNNREDVVENLHCRCSAGGHHDSSFGKCALVEHCVSGVCTVEVARCCALEPYCRIAVSQAFGIVLPLIHVYFTAGFAFLHLIVVEVAKLK